MAAAVAIWIIALISYLILSERNFDPARVYFLKILLALSCGILVGTLPGFFNVDFNVPGIAVRTAGGAAAFVFVYTQSPSVPSLGLAPPDIKVNQLQGIDFRSFADPNTASNFDTQQIAVTTPIEVRNERQPSVVGSLIKTELSFNLSNRRRVFRWYYFVHLLPGPGGSWLSSDQKLRSAVSNDLAPGVQFSEEVMHLSQDSPSWRDFVTTFRSLNDDFIVNVSVLLSTGEIERQCRIKPALYRAKIESDEKQLSHVPGFISTVCET